MNKPLHSSIDDEAEDTAKIRFKQQVFASVGGGMIFALVGVVTTALLTLSGGVMASALGIGAVAALGLGCVYFAAKFLSKAVSLDQDSQAKKIGAAARGKGPIIAPAIDAPTTKHNTVAYGPGTTQFVDKERKNVPDTTVSDIIAHERLAEMPSPSKAVH